MKRYPKKQQPHNFVLWANDFHELAAVTFATALRKEGLRTSIVGIFGKMSTGKYGLTVTADMDIGKARDLSAFAFTVIIPGEMSAIHEIEQHPTARRFFVQAYDHGARVVVHESVYQQLEKNPFLQRYQEQLTAYPQDDVVEFA